MSTRLITGLQWSLVGFWEHKDFLEVMKTEAAVLDIEVGGVHYGRYRLESVPMACGFLKEGKEEWLDLSRMPIRYNLTRISLPVWARPVVRTIPGGLSTIEGR